MPRLAEPRWPAAARRAPSEPRGNAAASLRKTRSFSERQRLAPPPETPPAVSPPSTPPVQAQAGRRVSRPLPPRRQRAAPAVRKRAPALGARRTTGGGPPKAGAAPRSTTPTRGRARARGRQAAPAPPAADSEAAALRSAAEDEAAARNALAHWLAQNGLAQAGPALRGAGVHSLPALAALRPNKLAGLGLDVVADLPNLLRGLEALKRSGLVAVAEPPRPRPPLSGDDDDDGRPAGDEATPTSLAGLLAKVSVAVCNPGRRPPHPTPP